MVYHLHDPSMRKDHLFCQKIVMQNIKGLDLGAELPRIKLVINKLTPPPVPTKFEIFSHDESFLYDLFQSRMHLERRPHKTIPRCSPWLEC